MNWLFKPRSLTWYQIGVFKLTMFCAGSFATMLFPFFFVPLAWFILGIFIIGSLYLIYIWFRQ